MGCLTASRDLGENRWPRAASSMVEQLTLNQLVEGSSPSRLTTNPRTKWSRFGHGREFLMTLDEFLAKLPRGWPYAVEIRNRNFLRAEYFAVLARHGAAHIFNSWTDMPPLSEQAALPGSFTSPDFFAARLLSPLDLRRPH